MIKRVKNILLDLWYWCTLPSYRLLRTSVLFDSDYYLATNPDVATSGVPPIFHYLTTGYKEWREPCLFFHSRYYNKQLSPEEIQTQAPLVHYLNTGWKSGLNPHPFFDHQHYISQLQDTDFSNVNPLLHFLSTKPNDKLCSPSPYFDPDFYCAQHTNTAKTAPDLITCYSHYLSTGIAESRSPSHYFDTEWYLDKTPVLSTQGFNPIDHYFMYGLNEKKSPSPLFDPSFYSDTYQVKDDNSDLFVHYFRHGMQQNHKPCEWFDPAYYRQRYLSGNQEAHIPLHHFLQQGRTRQLYPNQKVEQLTRKPVISILVPVYNAEISQLNNCIRSVIYQSYPHWELCLADDCSTHPEIRPLLEQWAANDERIQVTFLKKNSGISVATNTAAALANGEYLGLLDNDDELSPNALFYNIQAINEAGGDLFYSDEDLIGADGRQHSIFRKPVFNDELLLCHNYVTHFVVTKRTLFETVGCCDSSLDGAQDLDLFLRLSERAEKIVHIPKILYHWRASESSTSINHNQKDYASEAGRKSVEKAFARRSISGEAQLTELKYYYRAKRSVPAGISVTVMVNWEEKTGGIDSWLSHLLKTAGYPIQKIVVVLSDEMPNPAIHKFAENAGIAIHCHLLSKKTTFASACNQILQDIDSNYITFVSGDSVFQKKEWLHALLEHSQQDSIGMVGGMVQNEAEDLQKMRPIPDYAHSSPEYYAHYLSCCSVLMNGLQCPQEVQIVNFRLCLVQTELLRSAGAFDEKFPSLFAMHDFCYRLMEQGKQNIYTPYSHILLQNEEPVVITKEEEQALADEKVRFQQKWNHLLSKGDPFFNAALLSDNGLSTDQHKNWLVGEL